MGRLRRKKGTGTALRRFSDLVMEPKDAVEAKGKWKEFSGNALELILEIGTGKGRFLNHLAEKNPERHYVGMEKQGEVLIFAVKTAKEASLPNIHFIWSDVQFISEYFEPGELSEIHINFCDPWPKARHAKRRLTHQAFLNNYKKLMKNPGILHLKTDNGELFEYSLEQFELTGMELIHVCRDVHRVSPELCPIMTEYEEKFHGMGMPINYCQARFKAEDLEDVM
jgi:tRNA (guanine-N7-)-methyltransferase